MPPDARLNGKMVNGTTPTRAVAALVPILPSGDLERSLAYYRYLGFDVVERGADYARLSWRDAELHLYPHPAGDPSANTAGCYLRVADPAALRAAWTDDGVNCLDAANPSCYGPTAFAVVDPDGNTLRIGPQDDSEPPCVGPLRAV